MSNLHVCATPGCPKLTARRHCAGCDRTSTRNHGGVRRQRRGYDSVYAQARREMAGEPCELRLPGCTEIATSADHFDGGLRPACRHCQDVQGAALARAR